MKVFCHFLRNEYARIICKDKLVEDDTSQLMAISRDLVSFANRIPFTAQKNEPFAN